MMLLTLMFSDSPGTPGRRQQMPRTTRSMLTPACEARYSRSMIAGSTSAFILAQICAGLPFCALAISASINSNSRARRLIGAIQIFSRPAGVAYPVIKLKRRAASRHNAGSQVKNDKSV